MGQKFEGQVGPQTAGDNTTSPIRLSRDTAVVTQDAHGRYQEATFRGQTYILSTAAAGVTLAAANASTTAATAQPIVGLLNPYGSGVNAVILEIKYGLQSTGAAAVNEGIGVLQYAGGVNGNASTSIAGTAPTNLKQLGTSGSRMIGSVNQAYTGNTVTWSLLCPFSAASARTAAPTASINTPGVAREETAGMIIVPPGTAFGLFTLAAGTTITVAASIVWEEISAQ